MSDNLTASLSVGVIYLGDGSGLTPEQEEQLNKIPMIEQSIEQITNDLNTKANTSDIPTAIETYVTAHRDELKGETGSAGKDGVTPIFKIGNTATLDAGSLATVSIKKSPTTEEYTFDFGIPKGADGTTGSGSTTDLTDYQKKIDSTLITTNKTVVGAINELKTEIGDSNSGLAKDVADLKVNLNTVSTILDNINGEVI